MPQPHQIFVELSAPDRQLIDEEHARLERFLHDLCDTCDKFMLSADCTHCSQEKISSCQGRLPSFFHDFHDLVAEHFDHEEDMIGGVFPSPDTDDHLRQHQDAHTRLMSEMKHLIQASALLSQQGNVAAGIRQFFQLITDKFGEHERCFDSALRVAPLDWAVLGKRTSLHLAKADMEA